MMVITSYLKVDDFPKVAQGNIYLILYQMPGRFKGQQSILNIWSTIYGEDYRMNNKLGNYFLPFNGYVFTEDTVHYGH